jgi:hypothetical protein
MVLRPRDSLKVARAMGEPSASQSGTGQKIECNRAAGCGVIGSYQAGVHAALEAGGISLGLAAAVSIGVPNVVM